MGADLGRRELAAPHRRHVRSATWSIAAQLTRACPALVLDAMPTPGRDPDELLRVHVPGGPGRPWDRYEPALLFRRDSGITIWTPDDVEAVDWLDVLAQPFPDTTTAVLLDAIGRAGDVDGPSDLQLVHDFVATLLAVAVDAPEEWSVDYTPRGARVGLPPRCTIRRDGAEAIRIGFDEHRPGGSWILRPVTPLGGGGWPSRGRPRPVDLTSLFGKSDHDMLATVLTVVGDALAA